MSCIYRTEVFNATRTTVVGFPSKQMLAEMPTPNPLAIKRALAPARAATLIASGLLSCATCGKEASNVCSSLVVCRGTNRSANAIEMGCYAFHTHHGHLLDGEDKYQVLLFSERNICSCSDQRCISEARRRRNVLEERKGGQGFGTKLTFRGAIEPIGRVLSLFCVDEAIRPGLGVGIGQKENICGNIPINKVSDHAPTKMS